MPRTFLATLLFSATLFCIAGQLLEPTSSDSYSTLYPFLEKWARSSPTKMLTVVFDDYEQSHTLDVPRSIMENLNVSIRLVSLKQVILLKNENMDRDYQAIESGSCVLLLFLDLNHLRDILNSPHLVSFWQPENWYILQERKQHFHSFDYERFCKWAFERLWRFRRVYKLLLFTEDKVIRYDPFEHAGAHTRHYVNSTCDWHCIKSNEDRLLLVSEPNTTDISNFFDENRTNFKLYPLKISIFATTTMPFSDGKFSGLDFHYLEEACKNMNVTPVLMTSKDKFGWAEHGAFFGTVGHLVYEFADVSFNQFFIKDYLTRQVEFATSVSSDKMCVLVPKSPPVPEYLVIFKIFSVGAWFLIFIGHFVVSMVYTILKSKKSQRICDEIQRTGKELCSYKFPVESFLLEDRNDATFEIVPGTMEGVQFNGAGGVHPSKTSRNSRLAAETKEKNSKRLKRLLLPYFFTFGKYFIKLTLQIMQPYESSKPWFTERLFLICSLFLSLILNGLFTSQLASSFSKRMNYKDIDTLEELEESGLAILTNSRDVMQDVLSYSPSPVIKRLHMRLKYASELEIAKRLFETKDAGCLHRLSTVSYKYNKYQRDMLHVVKECPKDYILASIMTKGSPFRDRINNIVGRLNNGGFYWKWYESLFQSQHRAARESLDSSTHRKISIRHLFIPFGILYVGLATSAIVFIFERRRNRAR